jgi:D-glycero-alpha-D-manno-heptose-7-phosphate kinase
LPAPGGLNVIISRTPYRVSFFGGGTDYPVWFREHGGAVLAATINHYCYITCRFFPPFFDQANRIVWSKIEQVNEHSEIEHPAIRAALEFLKIDEGIELHHSGDLPARSGLGSSSAFAVGLLQTLHTLRDEEVSQKELAQQAIYLEQNLLGDNVGVQDQIQTAYGGLNRIDINPDGSFDVRPLELSEKRIKTLESHILLFYTGIARNASDIAAAQVRAIPNHKADLFEMRRLVDEATAVLRAGDLADFGRLLHESWQIKRRLSDRIAPNFVNDIYDRAKRAGAIGGKLLGAGGGGFMMFIVRPEDQSKVLSALNELLLVPAQFDWGGTQLIFKSVPRYSQTARHRRDYTRYMVGADGDVQSDIRSLGERLRAAVADGSLLPSKDNSLADGDRKRSRTRKTNSEVSKSSKRADAPGIRPRARKK